MTTREHLIQSLKRLCDDKGGYKAVADKAGVDDQSLYQILSGVKLPSGNAKGVGPTIQRKLDAAYPGWASAMPEDGNRVREDRATYGANPWPFRTLKPAALRAISDAQLSAIESVLTAAVNGMSPDDRWRRTAKQLAARLDQAIDADPSFELGADPFSKFVLQVDELVRETADTEPITPIN